MEDLKNYAHALLNAMEGKRADYLELEDKLENEGYEFEIDAIKNIMYFVVNKEHSHEMLDDMLAFGI